MLTMVALAYRANATILVFEKLIHDPGCSGGALACAWAAANPNELIDDALDHRLLDMCRVLKADLACPIGRLEENRLVGECREGDPAAAPHNLGAVLPLKAAEAPYANAMHARFKLKC